VKEGWEVMKIGSVCEIKPPKKIAKQKLSDNEEVTFFPMADLDKYNYYITPKTNRKLGEVYSGYVYFEDNDVLLAKITPCFENGKLGIANKLKNGIGFGSSEYIVLRPSNKVISEYIYYFLSIYSLRIIGKTKMVGAVGHKRIPIEYISNLDIIVQSIPEQKRIVAIIDKAFTAIDKAKANIENNIENTKELFQSKLNEIFSQKGDDWEEKRLPECFKLKSGEGLTKKNMIEGEYKVFGGNGIAGYHNDFNLSNENIVIGRVGALCGNVRYLNEKIWLTDNAFRITEFKFDFNYKFLEYLLTYKNLRRYARQSAQPVISNSSLSKITISFPKQKKEQCKIVDELNSISEETKKLETLYQHKIDKLVEFKKAVLEKAFKGELTNGKQKQVY